MKKNLLFLSAIFIVCSSFAQITITEADLPKPGTAFTLYYDNESTIDIGNSSSSAQTWDFSNLIISYPKFAVYSPTQPYHQYKDVFADANMYTYGPSYLYAGLFGGAPVDQNAWGYLYWQSDASGFSIVGFRGDYGLGDRNVLENPKELLMGVPATLDSEFTNSARWIVEYAEVASDYDSAYISTVQKTLTVDAFGTIVLPDTSFEVIRVHEQFIGIDSLAATFMGSNVYSVPLSNDTLNNYYFWALGVGYPVATIHADNNNNVIDIEYFHHKGSSYTISGKVYDYDGSSEINNGECQLIAKDAWDHLFGVEENVAIDANGNFQFSNVVYGNWMVLADPDPQQYNHTFPTYYGNQVSWLQSDYVSISSDTSITIICHGDSATTVQTGAGTISGTIWQDSTQTNKALETARRAGNVKVTLEENPGGAALLKTTTNDQGEFEFTNLTDREYQLRVELAGIHMDSTYVVDITSGSTHIQKDFLYDSTFVYVLESTVIDEFSYSSIQEVSIYPMPFTSTATVNITGIEGEFEYSMNIFDINGRLVNTFLGKTNDSFQINNNGMKEGIYPFVIDVNGTKVYSGKILNTSK